jgi:hypothetical protein
MPRHDPPRDDEDELAVLRSEIDALRERLAQDQQLFQHMLTIADRSHACVHCDKLAAILEQASRSG